MIGTAEPQRHSHPHPRLTESERNDHEWTGAPDPDAVAGGDAGLGRSSKDDWAQVLATLPVFSGVRKRVSISSPESNDTYRCADLKVLLESVEMNTLRIVAITAWECAAQTRLTHPERTV